MQRYSSSFPIQKKESNLLLNEEKKFREKLLQMKKTNLIPEKFCNKVKPVCSQTARFYGLAKVHKKNTPLRPIVAMPGSTNQALAAELGNYLRKLPEANVSTNVKKAQETLKELNLDEYENIISLDVVSLFTSVPVANAITTLATEKMYDSDCVEPPPMLEKTFKTLLEMVSIHVLFSDMDGAFYRQTDGIARGSPVAPLLANNFLAQYHDELGSNSKIYFRYVDDVIWSLITGGKQILVGFISTCHRNLTFTLAEPSLDGLLFLDISMKKINSKIVSIWYRKSTDTCVILNFNAVVPKTYLSGLTSGFVHRIFNACSNWEEFSKTWAEAEKTLTNNQYVNLSSRKNPHKDNF